jgi:hypothetical protein
MDEDNELDASIVRNLDVVVSSYRNIERIDDRLLEVTMLYLRELTDSFEWHLGGMAENSKHHGFSKHWFCPTAWVNETNPDDTEIYFEISSEEPDDEDFHWITCLTAALGEEASAMIRLEWPKLPKRNGSRNFVAREDVASEISSLGCEIDGSEIQCRFVIDREALAIAYESDDGDDLNDHFRQALSPIGDVLKKIVENQIIWDELRVKILNEVNV